MMLESTRCGDGDGEMPLQQDIDFVLEQCVLEPLCAMVNDDSESCREASLQLLLEYDPITISLLS